VYCVKRVNEEAVDPIARERERERVALHRRRGGREGGRERRWIIKIISRARLASREGETPRSR